MKKRGSFTAFLLANLFLFTVLLGNSRGANGPSVSGGGPSCSKKTDTVLENDKDQDTITDEADNCPSDYNPNQDDSDGNGIGEVCEEFQPLDGKIDCPLGPCESNDECAAALEEQCPLETNELSFLNLFLACCNNTCLVVEPTSGAICPVGTCESPSPNCSSDETCIEAGYDICVEGCCTFGEGGCECECPPETPDCECEVCQLICPDGGAAPQCETVEECGEGFFCDEQGCCIPEGEPPPPPGP